MQPFRDDTKHEHARCRENHADRENIPQIESVAQNTTYEQTL